jgi:hypothetical protein
MFKRPNYASALALAVGLSIAGPACAASGSFTAYQRDYRDFERRAYDSGFRSGVEHGERDARDRREFRVERSRDYRDADGGFRGYGDRDVYRRFFQDGFRAGYADGYNRIARFDRGRLVTPAVPYPDSRPGYASAAARVGYRDGFEAGRDDAHDRDPFDPRRAKRYREGDHDYSSRYGPRDDYKRQYRAAFEEGYAQGYREGRR